MELRTSEEKNLLLEKALQGMDVSYFDKLLKKTSLPKEVLTSIIGLSTRQVSSLKRRNKLFSPLQSEFLIKLDNLFSHGHKIFGDTGNFTEWLHLRSPGMGYQIPIQLLSTCTGVDLVDEELHRIAHGYVV